MEWLFRISIVGLLLSFCQVTRATSSPSLPVRLKQKFPLHSGVANIHIETETFREKLLLFTYGSCDSRDSRDSNHVIARNILPVDSSRVVWIIPEDAFSNGCISAWDESGNLAGRSDEQELPGESFKREVHRRRHADPGRRARRRDEAPIIMTNGTGFDVWGPWFDGVSVLKDNNLSAVDVETSKRKEIAIVGAGMSGLMTYLVLHQAGLKNVKILEAGQRLGGRVHTEYLTGGPFDYSYQEMGPMRVPYDTVFSNVTYNITDHHLVLRLAEEMNRINNHDKNLSVNFIPWIQNSENGLVYYNGVKLNNGLPPTQAQVAANSSFGPLTSLPPSTQALSDLVASRLPGEDFMVEMTKNIFQAHSDYINGGLDGLPGDQWSEFAFMVNYLNGSVDDASRISSGIDYGGYLEQMYEKLLFGPNSTFRTIDGGMNRLPLSFHPLVNNATALGRKIERVQWDENRGKVTLQSRSNYSEPDLYTETYDYAIIAVPFSIVRKWKLPSLPSTLKNAIDSLPYWTACKVALEYKTRFWEQLDNPIYGSCSTMTDIPGIGSICYPSYNINGTGPASVLASFIPGQPLGVDWVSVSEEQHVRYVVDAMAEIHGEVARESYTGKYKRRCWALDEFTAAGWASPTIGDHQVYLPQYLKTHKHLIFVGEHTSYTHAWIASALESGIRGGVQMLLELGLIDEAKETVNKWMARWINVVSVIYTHGATDRTTSFYSSNAVCQ